MIFFLATGLVDLLIMGPMLVGPMLVGPLLFRNTIFGAEQISGGRLSGLGFHYLFCFGPSRADAFKRLFGGAHPSGMHTQRYSTRPQTRNSLV